MVASRSSRCRKETAALQRSLGRVGAGTVNRMIDAGTYEAKTDFDYVQPAEVIGGTGGRKGRARRR